MKACRQKRKIFRSHKGFITLLLLVSLFSIPRTWAVVTGEQGRLFMQTFSLNETGGASQNFAIVQDSLGLMYVANLMSVLEYDGVRWRSISHPERLRPVSMDIDNTGRIFVGFQGDIGFLQVDRLGRKRIISLKSQLPGEIGNIGYIWGTKATKDGVFFRSQNILFRWQPPILSYKQEKCKSGSSHQIIS